MRVEIVGFSIADALLKAELNRVAAETGGTYHDARDAAGLRQAIAQALAVPYEVWDVSGGKIADGLVGKGLMLPDGTYELRLQRKGSPLILSHVKVVSEEQTAIVVNYDGSEYRPARHQGQDAERTVQRESERRAQARSGRAACPPDSPSPRK